MKTTRLKWNDIVSQFPNTWVRLEEVEWNPTNDNDVVSAVVTRVGEATPADISDAIKGRSVERFTSVNTSPQIGAVLL